MHDRINAFEYTKGFLLIILNEFDMIQKKDQSSFDKNKSIRTCVERFQKKKNSLSALYDFKRKLVLLKSVEYCMASFYVLHTMYFYGAENQNSWKNNIEKWSMFCHTLFRFVCFSSASSFLSLGELCYYELFTKLNEWRTILLNVLCSLLGKLICFEVSKNAIRLSQKSFK